MTKKLIPKAQYGWLTQFLPSNWGIPTYKTKTLKEAQLKALEEGEERFIYDNVVYSATPGDSTSMKKQIDWFKTYLETYPVEKIELNKQDSIQANGNYTKQRQKKLQKVINKLNTFNLKNAVVVKPYSNTGLTGQVYKTDLYAHDTPGVLVHELTHYTGADKLKTVKVPDYVYPIFPTKDEKYALSNDELNASEAEYQYLYDNNLFKKYNWGEHMYIFDFHNKTPKSEEYDDYLQYLKDSGVNVEEEIKNGNDF